VRETFQPGLPDGILSYQNRNLGKFWRALEWKRFVYSMPIWNILCPFGIFYSYLVILWKFGIFFPRFAILCQLKSGNPLSNECADVGKQDWSQNFLQMILQNELIFSDNVESVSVSPEILFCCHNFPESIITLIHSVERPSK
jgi:hypothetical protein